ncbi:MAG: lactate racemase domain-containing protein, partial [bacterium]|nr:lactate racemase domain-containing protein [bacterium]
MRDEMMYRRVAEGGPLGEGEQRRGIRALFAPWGMRVRRLLIIPPDITRANSGAGQLTRLIVEHVRRFVPRAEVEILPAVGTHVAMTAREREEMFGELPGVVFREHNWRTGLVRLGEVPGTFVEKVSGGRVRYSIA